MKTILFSLAVIVTAVQVKAQQQAIFKPVFSPKSKYSDNRTMTMNMNMQAGGQNMDMDMMMKSLATTETGTPDKDHNTPVTISNKTIDMKTTMNGNDTPVGPIPAATIVVYGKYNADSRLSVDSVAGQSLNDSLRSTMIQLVETMQNSVKFPDHPVKIGDSFTIGAPFNMGAMMPMVKGGNMTVNTTYKLLGISNDVARFEVFQNMDIDLSKSNVTQAPGMTAVIKGVGGGTMTYDLKKQCIIAMTNTMDMTYDMGFSGQTVTGKGKAVTTDAMTVSAN